jgi:hypothetical protein
MAEKKIQAGAYQKPTAEQIAEWKKQHPEGVFHVPIEDKECYMHFPDLNTLKFAVQEAKKSAMGFNRVIIDNCWIDGDPEIKADDRYYLALCTALDEIVEIPEYTVTKRTDSKLGVVNDVKVGDLSCVLKTPTRDQIDAASRGNKKALDQPIRLVEMLWVEGDKKIKSQSNTYAALLSAVDELTDKKTAVVKKL